MTKGWIKDIYQTLFRFARFSCEPETVAIGNPDRSSPLLVTCNFDYTVRHLKQYLEREKLDCFLLVVNTRGTNVWCAAAEGVLDTERVVAHLTAFDVSNLVDHRRLILPQLSAAGVKRKGLRERGWEATYGPVYFSDLKKFIDNGFTKNRDMQYLEYGYWERFKMGISHATFCLLVCIIPILVLARTWWVEGVISVVYLALGMQLVEQFLPFKRLLYKGLLLAVPLLVLLSISGADPVLRIRAGIVAVALGAYIGFDSQGQSHFAQNQHSGKILVTILAILAALYGATLWV